MDEPKYVYYGDKDNGNAIASFVDNKSLKSSKSLKSASSTKEEEKKVWDEIVGGDDEKWKDMSTADKVKRIILNILKICSVLTCLYFFICSLDLLSSSFRLISGKSTGAVMGNDYVSNPIVGLMIGILVTVLVQSSSTSTSIIVSMVSAQILTVHDAIPMVMGANIGTSVTNTIVSLTQVGDREIFRRAFSGATVHDMFNWLAVLVLLPLEIVSGMLEKLTGAIVNSLSSGNGAEVKLLTVITEPFTKLIIQLDSQILQCWGMGFMSDEDSMVKKYCDYEFYNETDTTMTSVVSTTEVSYGSTQATTPLPIMCIKNTSIIGIPNTCKFLFYQTSMSDSTIGIILLIMSLTILCTSLIMVVKILNSLLQGSIAKVIQKVINANIPYVPWLTGYIAILIGGVLTFIVQSSSVFTSTMTPLIGIGMITVERAYPLTLGSNLGTTTTALLAAMAAPSNKRDSIQIALVHAFFNIFGILIYYPIPFMRFPIVLCKKLGNITAVYRWFAIVYLITMFFVFPGSVFALSMGGTAVLWGVLGPILFIVVVIIIINMVQDRAPRFLPHVLRNWDYLPEPLRSLDPYDRMVTSMPCCKTCRADQIVEDEISEVITETSLSKRNSKSSTKSGIDNPIKVLDS